MSTTIDKLQIEIESNSDGAIKGLSKLKSTLKSLDKISKSSGLDKVCQKLKEISSINFSNLNSLNNLGDSTRKVEELSKRVDKLASAMSDVPDTIDVDTDTGGISDAINDVDRVSDAVDSLPKNVEVPINTPGADNATNKASLFNRVVSKIGAVTSKALSGIKAMADRLHYAAGAFSKTTAKAGLLSQVLRIVVIYGGAFRLFMMLTQGVAEGLENLAQYNNETAAAMGQLSTMALTLKNSIAAALYPVIVALTPALNSVTNAIVRVCEAFGQLVSLLSGKSTYLRAKKYTKAYVDAVGKAGGKATKSAKDTAKEIKKTFAGMDEITTIGDKNKDSSAGSGGSGGGAAGGDDYGAMFEEVPIDNPKLKALLPFFEGLGKILSSCFDTIKRLANDYLYPWLVNLGNWCSEHPEALKTIGEGLGYVVVALAGITAAKGAIKVLKYLLSPLSSLVEFLTRLTGLPKMGITLTITGIALETAGIISAIKKGLNKINFAEILTGGVSLSIGGALIGKALGSAILGGAIGGIIAGIPAFGVGIFDAIKSGLDWLNAALISAGATAAGAGIGAIIGMCGGPIGAGIGALIGLAVGLITDGIILLVQNWDSVVAYFEGVWTAIAGFFTNLWNDIVFVWKGVAEWFDTTVISPITNFFTDLWNNISSTASLCWENIVNFFTPALDWFSSLFDSIFKTISDVFCNIGVIAKGCWEIIKAVWSIVSDWFNTKVIQPVHKFFTTLWNDISSAAKSAWDGIKEVYSTISDWIDTNIITPVGNFFTDLWNGFVSKAEKAWNGVKEVFGKVSEFFYDTFSKAWSGIVKVFSVGGQIFVDIKDGVVAAFKTVVNGLIRGINKVISVPFNAINSALNTIRNVKILDLQPFKGLRTINVPQIPTFANGGFPEDGLFMANHGELVGQFAGGKTAVANNEQIIEGIQSGVYAANREQNNLLREQNKLLRQIAEKESNGELNISTITKAIARKNRRDGRTIIPVGT